MIREFFNTKIKKRYKTAYHKFEIPKLRHLLELKFLNLSYNSWILDDKYFHRGLKELIYSFDKTKLIHFLNSRDIAFVTATGQLGCTLTYDVDMDIIIIFPDLLKMLYSASPRDGVAILSHEFGHIYHNHSNKNISIIKAQVEADFFAYQTGFGKELHEILLQFNSLDCRTRVTYLTSYLLSN